MAMSRSARSLLLFVCSCFLSKESAKKGRENGQKGSAILSVDGTKERGWADSVQNTIAKTKQPRQ